MFDLLFFNRFVRKTAFKIETCASVSQSIRRDDWMVSMDLKDMFFQVRYIVSYASISVLCGRT